MLEFITMERLLVFFVGMLAGFIAQTIYKNRSEHNNEDEFMDELEDKMAVIEELRNYVSRLEQVPKQNKKQNTQYKKNYRFKNTNSSKDAPTQSRKRKSKAE